MLLAIDIGNTNIVIGAFEDSELRHSWRIATRRDQTADEYAVLCRNLFGLSDLTATDCRAVVISSVVPPLNEYFEELSVKYFGIQPVFVDPKKQDVIPVIYDLLSEVGADRIVNAVAALDLLEPPIIIVDFGTATTFDAIDEDGRYIGGVIAPGVGISSEALFARASMLPRIEIRRPSQVIGGSTVSSMQSGIYFGYVALVEGVLARMKEELGPAHVIATGGFAVMIAEDLDEINLVEENLTLFGLRSLFLRTNPSPNR